MWEKKATTRWPFDRNNWQTALVRQQQRGSREKSYKERFLNPSCCLLRRPPTPRPPHPKKGEKTAASLWVNRHRESSIIQFESPLVRPRLSHSFPVSQTGNTVRGCQTNITVAKLFRRCVCSRWLHWFLNVVELTEDEMPEKTRWTV